MSVIISDEMKIDRRPIDNSRETRWKRHKYVYKRATMQGVLRSICSSIKPIVIDNNDPLKHQNARLVDGSGAAIASEPQRIYNVRVLRVIGTPWDEFKKKSHPTIFF